MGDANAAKKYLAEMTSQEAEHAFRRVDTALMTTGSTEHHGPHCALGLDYLGAWRITQLVAEQVECVFCPSLPIGISGIWMDFPGTLTLRRETFAAMTEDVVLSLIWQGAKRVVIINGHGQNSAILTELCQKVRFATGALVTSVDWWKVLESFSTEVGFKNPPEDFPTSHAGEMETSTLMAAGEDWGLDLVRIEHATRPEFVKHPFPGVATIGTSQIQLPLAVTFDGFGDYRPTIGLHIRELSVEGVLGNPVGSSAETGRRILKLVSDRISSYVKTVQEIPVEVHTRPRFF